MAIDGNADLASAEDFTDATAISSGGSSNCAIRSTGQAVCWGSNELGELGDGGAEEWSNVPVNVSGLNDAVAISGRYQTNCAIRSTGQAVCWGANESGELGDGNSSGPEACYAEPCSTVPREVVGLSNAETISVGYQHACAIRKTGQAVCWGANENGELGDETTTPRPLPTNVKDLPNASLISAGGQFTCATHVSGQVVCWGDDSAGELADKTLTDRHTPVDVSGLSEVVDLSSGVLHTCAIRLSGQVVCWGTNGEGQLGNGLSQEEYVWGEVTNVLGLTDGFELGAGENHTCAIRTHHALGCWGYNSLGQLGNGTTEVGYLIAEVPGFDDVEAISGGGGTTCAVRVPGREYCWGANSLGQLGDAGSEYYSATPVPVHAPRSKEEPLTGGGGSGGGGNSMPSSVFTLAKPKVSKGKGTAAITFDLPGPGSVDLSGKGIKRARKAVNAAGSVTLAVIPTAKTKKRLKATGKVTISVTASYTPTGGSTATKTIPVKLSARRFRGA